MAQILYSDVNMSVGIGSSYELSYNSDSIQNSIFTILGTRIGTRPFRRNFGSYLMDILFDPVDPITADRIKTELINAIETWEPRVTITQYEVLPDYANQMYYVSLQFIVPKLSNQSVSLTFNLQKGG